MKKPATVTGDNGRTGGTLDLISKLPDELLVRILSLLPTTKAAVRTCLVSKRWQFLWTSIDKLILFCESKSEADKVLSLMYYVLLQRLKIKKFYLECWGMPSYNLHLDRWLAFLVENKVEHVVLKSDFFKDFNLPKFFYTCSSLVKLELSKYVFDKQAVISWKSLKSVSFMTVMLDDESIVKLLSGCPVLETLELSFFHGFHRLEIKNPNLKTIKLSNFWIMYEREGSLEIVAPYLQYLEISGRLGDFKCRLKNVSSLVSAELTFNIKCELRSSFGRFGIDEGSYHQGFWTLVQDYLRKLKHVSELTIGTWFAEVLFRLQLDGVELPELLSKCLTLKLYILKCNLYGVATLLRASPHVETLNIELDANGDCRHCNYEASYLHEGDDIDLENWIPNFEFPNLKSVNIICSRVMCSLKETHDKLFELSKFLLKNATVLEKFLIIAMRGKCRFCMNCVSPYSSKLAAKLSECPRSSTNCMMVFRDSYLR